MRRMSSIQVAKVLRKLKKQTQETFVSKIAYNALGVRYMCLCACGCTLAYVKARSHSWVPSSMALHLDF